MWRILIITLVVSAGADTLSFAENPAAEAEQISKIRELVERQMAEEAKQNAERQEGIDQKYLKLQNDLDSNDPQRRTRAIWSICNSQDARLIPVIRMLLSSSTPSTRKQAILALYRFQASNAAADIGKLIADVDPDVRHTAAEYGSYLGYKSSIDEVKRFLQDPDFGSQSIALHLARTLPPQQAVPILGIFLRHSSPHLRKRAVCDLMKYDDEQVRPYAREILALAGDPDTWVRQAVGEAERRLQNLLTTAELRQLFDHRSAEVRSAVLRMLGESGAEASRELAAALKAEEPILRETALRCYAKKGLGPERAIVALLNDPDARVKSSAIEAVSRLQFRSAVPALQEIFRTAERYDRQRAAETLLKMDEPLWGATKPPRTSGPLFKTAEKLAEGEQPAWGKLQERTVQLIDELSKLKGFPCDRGKQILAEDLSGRMIVTRAPSDDHSGGRLGGHTLSRVIDSVVVVHGNLAVNGYMNRSLVIVTGDLYLHGGYIYDSIVLVQGSIVCEGYLNNSVVAAGEKAKLTLDGGYIWGSVAAAGTIDCDGYYQDSLLGGSLVADSSGRIDLRQSSRFDARSLYDRLRRTKAERQN